MQRLGQPLEGLGVETLRHPGRVRFVRPLLAATPRAFRHVEAVAAHSMVSDGLIAPSPDGLQEAAADDWDAVSVGPADRPGDRAVGHANDLDPAADGTL